MRPNHFAGKLLFLLAVLPPLAVKAQNIVFQAANSSESSLDQASIPVLGNNGYYDGTSYDIASSNAAFLPNSADLILPSTSSGFLEAQAIFTQTPISLATPGDYIELTVAAYDYSILASPGTANSSLNLGLFNSGGSLPLTNLSNSGLSSAGGSPNATGGTQKWQGYVGRALESGTTSMFVRSQQTGSGTTSQNQDLLFNGAGMGSYQNPAGTVLGTQSNSAISIPLLAPVDMDFKITLTTTGLSITNSLYFNSEFTDPPFTTSPVFTQTATVPSADDLTQTFDGLAFGFRYSGSDAEAEMNFIGVTVEDSIQPVPEPGGILLIALVGGTLLMRQWRRGDKVEIYAARM